MKLVDRQIMDHPKRDQAECRQSHSKAGNINDRVAQVPSQAPYRCDEVVSEHVIRI